MSLVSLFLINFRNDDDDDFMSNYTVQRLFTVLNDVVKKTNNSKYFQTDHK